MLKKLKRNIQLVLIYLSRFIFSNFFYFIWLNFYEERLINKNKAKLKNLKKNITGKNVLIIGSGSTNLDLDEIIKNDKYQVILFINHSIKLTKTIFHYDCRNKLFIWFTGDYGRYKEILNYQKKYLKRVNFLILSGLLPWYYPLNIKLFKSKFTYIPPSNIFFRKVLESKRIGEFIPKIIDANIYSFQNITNAIDIFLNSNNEKLPIIPHSSFFGALLLMAQNNAKSISYLGCDLGGYYANGLKFKKEIFKVNNDIYPNIYDIKNYIEESIQTKKIQIKNLNLN